MINPKFPKQQKTHRVVKFFLWVVFFVTAGIVAYTLGDADSTTASAVAIIDTALCMIEFIRAVFVFYKQ